MYPMGPGPGYLASLSCSFFVFKTGLIIISLGFLGLDVLLGGRPLHTLKQHGNVGYYLTLSFSTNT